ncbi:MAG: hypothetical protein ACRDA4_07525 [Filifactoraceae bacterium]
MDILLVNGDIKNFRGENYNYLGIKIRKYTYFRKRIEFDDKNIITGRLREKTNALHAKAC